MRNFYSFQLNTELVYQQNKKFKIYRLNYMFLQVKIVFNKSVSWVRVRDDHILTVDQITFIADERFHALHASENLASQSSLSSSSTLFNQRRQLTEATTTTQKFLNSNQNINSANAPWTLQIKYVQARDVGLYECQISAEPKISARVYLHVVGELIFCALIRIFRRKRFHIFV